MAFVDYDPDETLEYYIQDEKMLAEISRDGLLEQIEELFWKGSGFTSYQKSSFLSFFLYLTGDYRRMRVVCGRLFRIRRQDWVPVTAQTFLDGWFADKVPGNAVVDPAALEAGPLPVLRNLETAVSRRSAAYIEHIKQAFHHFFERTDDEFFLKSCEIHAEELRDQELESKALRWEYKYLGREPEKIKKRWKIYRERQSEWPKSN